MKLGDLIKVLEGMDPTLDVVVDADENGYYGVSGANTKEVEGGKVVNIVSTNSGN